MNMEVDTPGKMNLLAIPTELLHIILLLVPGQALPAIFPVSSVFAAISREEYFWKRKTVRDFPVAEKIIRGSVPFPPQVTNYRELYPLLAHDTLWYFPVIYDGESYRNNDDSPRNGIWLSKGDTSKYIYDQLSVRMEPISNKTRKGCEEFLVTMRKLGR